MAVQILVRKLRFMLKYKNMQIQLPNNLAVNLVMGSLVERTSLIRTPKGQSEVSVLEIRGVRIREVTMMKSLLQPTDRLECSVTKIKPKILRHVNF